MKFLIKLNQAQTSFRVYVFIRVCVFVCSRVCVSVSLYLPPESQQLSVCAAYLQEGHFIFF